MRHRTRGRTRNSRTLRAHGARDEAGAVLILALVYLVAVSVIVGGLTDWAMNDLKNTGNFSSARSTQTAATSAVETAIQSIRYAPLLFATSSASQQTLNASPPVPCWGNGASPSGLTAASVGANINVWCSTGWNPTSALTRVVTFSACPSSVSSGAQCALQPLLQTVVTFDDYPPGIQTPTTSQCVTYCGTSMTVNSWLWSPAVPVVQSLSWSSTPVPTITGGTAITINGTGFSPNATSVNFVDESAGSPVNSNVVIPCTTSTTACTVSGVTSTQLTVTSPPVTTGSTYYVTVTTPGGTSADCATAPGSGSCSGPGDVFTFSPLVVPVVTSVSGPVPPGISNAGGSTGGGTQVTITGTGFFSGATVQFIPVLGGASVAATSVSVTAPTTITAYSPPVAAAANYYLEVTTQGGPSTATNDLFTYETPIPNPA
jgi:large repetitive protein